MGAGLRLALVAILALVEVTIGALLIVNRSVPLASFVSSILLLLFSALGVLLIGDPVPCGCFGELIEQETDGIFLVRNLLLLFASLFILKRCKEAETASAL